MSATEPHVQVSRYTVNCLPADTTQAYLWNLYVERNRDGTWSVTDGAMFLDASCDWHHSRRDAGWHTLAQGLSIAEAVAPHLTINGMTPADALARIARIDAEEADR